MTATVPRVAGPSPEQVVLLQSVRDDPCVSLLATTTPAPRMTDADEAALVQLALQRAAAAGLPARITVHRLRGLDGPRRERLLDRAVARLARRLDALPVGWPVP